MQWKHWKVRGNTGLGSTSQLSLEEVSEEKRNVSKITKNFLLSTDLEINTEKKTNPFKTNFVEELVLKLHFVLSCSELPIC